MVSVPRESARRPSRDHANSKILPDVKRVGGCRSAAQRLLPDVAYAILIGDKGDGLLIGRPENG